MIAVVKSKYDVGDEVLVAIHTPETVQRRAHIEQVFFNEETRHFSYTSYIKLFGKLELRKFPERDVLRKI